MSYIVTGAAGFIGMHTALALLKRGDRVVGIDNLNDYYPIPLKRARLAELESFGDAFRFVEGDIARSKTRMPMFRAMWSGISIFSKRCGIQIPLSTSPMRPRHRSMAQIRSSHFPKITALINRFRCMLLPNALMN